MNKRIFFALILIISISFLSGCNSNLLYLSRKVISEYRETLFAASVEDFNATFTSGKREASYFYDGMNSTLVEFGVLSIQYNGKLVAGTEPQYVLFIDTMQYAGFLQFNPIDGTYVADIEKCISNKADMYLRVYGGGVDDQTQMICISNNWKVSYKEAFNIAVDEFKPQLKTQIKNNRIQGEFFIKIVGDKLNQILNICWYISYLGEDGLTLACIIDVNTGEILAKKLINNLI